MRGKDTRHDWKIIDKVPYINLIGDWTGYYTVGLIESGLDTLIYCRLKKNTNANPSLTLICAVDY